MPESLFKYILQRQSALPLELVSALGSDGYAMDQPAFDELLRQNINILRKFASDPVLLNGLLYSSHSFLERLSTFQQKSLSDFRKKEWQSARTLALYLVRIAAKTSPFAGFTAIGVATTQSQIPADFSISKTADVQYNHLVFSWIKEQLSAFPPFYNFLKIRLNSLIINDNEHYIFLLNSRNVESVQYLEIQPILDFLRDLLLDNGLEYAELKAQLIEATGESADAIEPLLNQLLEIGFLDFDWELPLTVPDFLPRLIDKTRRLPSFEKQQPLLDTFVFLQEALQKYIIEKLPETRLELMQQITTRLKSFMPLLFANEQAAVDNKTWFGRFEPLDYPFSTEQIFYEDKYQPQVTHIEEENLLPLTQKLTAVLELVETFSNKDEFSFQKHVYQKCQTGNAPVPLLLFYEQYYLLKNSQPANKASNDDSLMQFLQKSVTGNHNEVVISNSSLNSPVFNRLKKEDSYGALLQPFGDSNAPGAVVNATFRGNGRMWGRYLDALPPDVHKEISERNQLNDNDLMEAEIADASCMNANLHPPLLPYQIVIAPGESDFPADRQIPLKELAVALEEEGKAVVLRHLPSGKRVVPFDMGLEAPANRSPMYQMLLDFSMPFPSHRIFVRAVNQLFSEKEPSGIRQFPRISIDGKLILQRRGWQIPYDNIPSKPAHISLFEYYRQLKKWQISLELPEKVFYSIFPADSEKNAIPRDQLKPQYLDFSSPILVDIFHRHIKKGAFVRMEEMLPVPEQLAQQNTFFCTEWILEYRYSINH